MMTATPETLQATPAAPERRATATILVAILAAAWSLDALSWPVWVFVVLGVNANQIHKWNHMPKARRPFLVRALQDPRLIQSSRDHAAHHRGEKNTAYCVITPFLNPLLDATGFWRGLEKLTVPMLGAPRREDLHRQANVIAGFTLQSFFNEWRPEMNRDQAKGTMKDVAGKIQRKTGEVTGNTTQQVKGAARQVAGKVQKAVGDVRNDADKRRDRNEPR